MYILIILLFKQKNNIWGMKVNKIKYFLKIKMHFSLPDTDTVDAVSESHSGHQQLRFTRNYMGAWRTWRRPLTSSLLLDSSCRRTRSRRRCCFWSIIVCITLLQNIISTLFSTRSFQPPYEPEGIIQHLGSIKCASVLVNVTPLFCLVVTY